MPWLDFGRKCCQVFGIMRTRYRVALLFALNVVEHTDKIMILSSKDSDFFNTLLGVNGRSTR